MRAVAANVPGRIEQLGARDRDVAVVVAARQEHAAVGQQRGGVARARRAHRERGAHLDGSAAARGDLTFALALPFTFGFALAGSRAGGRAPRRARSRCTPPRARERSTAADMRIMSTRIARRSATSTPSVAIPRGTALHATAGWQNARCRARDDRPRTWCSCSSPSCCRAAKRSATSGSRRSSSSATHRRALPAGPARDRPAARHRARRPQCGFTLNRRRARFDVDAIDVPPSAARSLSLLMVAAQLLPAHLGVREAVNRTVRAALRLRGMKAAAELRRLEDAVLVLENDAKDYQGKAEISPARRRSARGAARHRPLPIPKSDQSDDEMFFPASIGLYKGGLYVLAVPADDDGGGATWRALERIEEAPRLTTSPPGARRYAPRSGAAPSTRRGGAGARRDRAARAGHHAALQRRRRALRAGAAVARARGGRDVADRTEGAACACRCACPARQTCSSRG